MIIINQLNRDFMRTKKCKNKKCDQFLTENPQFCKCCTKNPTRKEFNVCLCQKKDELYRKGYCILCVNTPKRRHCAISSCNIKTNNSYCSNHKYMKMRAKKRLKKRFKFIKPKHTRCYFCNKPPRKKRNRYINKYYLCHDHVKPKYLNKLRRRDFKEKCLKKEYNSRKTRFNGDIKYRLIQNLRSRLYMFTKESVIKKTKKFNDYIGCTGEELKNYLEKQFQIGMSWDNYGKWHIDHIIPLSSFKTEEELYKLCHYTNLQPLWASENIAKHNKITHQKKI